MPSAPANTARCGSAATSGEIGVGVPSVSSGTYGGLATTRSRAASTGQPVGPACAAIAAANPPGSVTSAATTATRVATGTG